MSIFDFSRVVICFIIVSLCGIFIFSACSTKQDLAFKNWVEQEDKVRILSTTAMIGNVVEQIGQQKVASLVLIQEELDPHSYELVKGDDEKIQLADAVFYNGLGLEHGASLYYQLKNQKKAIAVAEAIQERHPEKMIYVNGACDPHVWMDVSLWVETVKPIVEQLVSIDPKHADYYQKNAVEYREKLLELHRYITKILQSVPQEKRYLVTSHDAFNYFTRAYLATEEEKQYEKWHQRFQAPEGLAPDSQLSLLDIKRIISHLKRYEILVIFPESNVSQDSLKKIVDCMHHQGKSLVIASDVLYGDSMGPCSEDNPASYMKMLEYDAGVLMHYWKE
jgi:manganese/zinc/iron transport system substrate-binding protein